LVATLGYVRDGAGPLAANYAPPMVTDHALSAAELAASIPAQAAVSASSAPAPHLSQRPRVYLFPTVLDADYVVLDLRATAAPTSPGDVYLQVRDRLANGGWEVASAEDGLLVLH